MKDLALYTPGWKILADITMSAQGSQAICVRKILSKKHLLTINAKYQRRTLLELVFGYLAICHLE